MSIIEYEYIYFRLIKIYVEDTYKLIITFLKSRLLYNYDKKYDYYLIKIMS